METTQYNQQSEIRNEKHGNFPSIIIIGAGTAGLSAAKKLLDNGFQNLKILEAEPRIGGRIHSVYLGENFVDLGARWCHGEVDNIVFSMVKKLDLLEFSKMPKKFFYSTGSKVDEQLGNELWDIMDKIYISNAHYRVEYKTYGDYCTEQYNKIIDEKYGTNKKNKKIAKEVAHFFELDVLSNESCASWYESTAQNDYKECKGNNNLNWKGKGFKKFLEVLLDKNQNITEVEKTVIFNKEVKQITWNNNHVQILCSDFNIFLADHVIVTVPLGVLKENIKELFHPCLPVEKEKAIENMGFGCVMKVAMCFSKKWWDNYGFNLIWSKEDREQSIEEFPDGPNFDNNSWVTYMPYLIEADNNPKVLMAWFTGPLVKKIELLPQNTLCEGIMYVLKKFLGRFYEIPYPDEIRTTNWYSNPHFRGTYSFQTTTAKRGNKAKNAQEILAEPIRNNEEKPVVQFAGEATSAHHYSTVHGAVETGFREANVIIDYYKKNVPGEELNN